MLEVFNNLFMSIAEQMGVALQNTAYSVNIKERLDFSCAVFDGTGSLVANAPHMPVHLGSMDRAVETIIRENQGKIRPGDVYLINAPYNGGTHHSRSHRLHAGVRSRAKEYPVLGRLARPSCRYRRHCARLDVADRHHDREEGIYIDNFKLVERGNFREQALRPAHQRRISGAQSAAERQRSQGADRRQRKGRAGNAQDGAHFRLKVVHAYMKHVQDNADESVRRVIDRLHDSAFAVRDADQGNVITVKISVDKKRREATVDFTGTTPQQGTNFNAPEPVTRAAVLYVFRVMVDDDIPMNAGCLRPIHIVIPNNSMLSPRYPAAVVAGNVEVSQMVTDTACSVRSAPWRRRRAP